MSHKKEKYVRAEIPMISVNANYICLYTDKGQFTGRGKSDSNNFFVDPVTFEVTKLGRTDKQIAAEENLKDNSTNGIISNKAAKRINQAISWFSAMSATHTRVSKNNIRVSSKLNFITLTLSSKQKHDDLYIKSKLLNAFLVDLRRRFFVISYMWRAEAQINGNIHFHIVVNKYVHYTHIRNIWNRIQAEHGYIPDYDVKSKWGGDNNPPSTEIKKVYKCKNIAGYLSKYCSKNLNAMKVYSNIDNNKLQQVVKASGRKNKDGIAENPGLLAAKFIDNENCYMLKYDSSLIDPAKVAELIQATGAIVMHYVDIPLRPIEGRHWFCSTTITKMKNVADVISNDVEIDLQNILQKGCIKYTKIVKEYVTVLCFNVMEYVAKGMFEGLKQLIRLNQNKWVQNENETYLRLLMKAA